jgi:hypothetical protein
MPNIVQSFSGVHAVTQGVTNPSTPPAQVVVISDGEGNIVTPESAAPQIILTFLSTAQTAGNTGTSFSTSGISSLAIDATVTAFTGGTAPTIAFFIDRLGADGVWYRVWTEGSPLSSPGVVSENIGPGQSGTNGTSAVLTGTARFGWVFTGAPTSVTFSASVIGR